MGFSEAVKLEVRRKAHFKCCICHESSVSLEVHHIISKAEGGPDTIDNAAPLCPSCHEDYGANPAKRTAIRVQRDFWYEQCAKRYGSGPDGLSQVEELLDRRLTGFQEFLEERLEQVHGPNQLYRSEKQILEELEILFDLIWYNRHLNMLCRVETGQEAIKPEVLEVALAAAQRKRDEYGEENLGPWTDFEWGMLNGKMSALRWVMGDEWDFLDT